MRSYRKHKLRPTTLRAKKKTINDGRWSHVSEPIPSSEGCCNVSSWLEPMLAAFNLYDAPSWMILAFRSNLIRRCNDPIAPATGELSRETFGTSSDRSINITRAPPGRFEWLNYISSLVFFIIIWSGFNYTFSDQPWISLPQFDSGLMPDYRIAITSSDWWFWIIQILIDY